MFNAFLRAYPWDLVDGDLDATLDQLRGDIGLTGLSVWAASPPVCYLRPRPIEPRFVRDHGGLFFHPDGQRYSGTRCKPTVAAWLRGKDPIPRIAAACTERHGLSLRLVVSGSRTGRLAERYPEMACKNAYDGVSVERVCLSNPDVQSWLTSLTSELARFEGISGATISDFVLGGCDGGALQTGFGSGFGPVETALLSLCFCESCHQGAQSKGVDVLAARRTVRSLVDGALQSGRATDASVAAVIADAPALADFARRGVDQLGLLWERMVGASPVEILLDRDAGGIGVWPDGDQAHKPQRTVITGVSSGEQLGLAFDRDALRNELRMGAPLVQGLPASDLVRLVSDAAETGFTGVEFDDYGSLAEASFTPLKQAVRFARRTADTRSS
jgi:hypothetical protein